MSAYSIPANMITPSMSTARDQKNIFIEELHTDVREQIIVTEDVGVAHLVHTGHAKVLKGGCPARKTIYTQKFRYLINSEVDQPKLTG